MYQQLGTIKLKSGEEVEAGVIRGPDLTWAPRMLDLLSHKGDPWNWQNAQILQRDLGIDAFFYILHRNGDPFANIMTIEQAGVGHFGHVWTQPEDRKQGASSRLMQLQMAHFRDRGGRALFLGTAFDSVPHHMYAKHGFRCVEAGSGYMAYFVNSREAFAADYFRISDVEIVPLDWSHWPASAALYLWDFPGIVRSVGGKLIGQQSTEGPFLDLLNRANRYAQNQHPAPAQILQAASTAVVGCAMWNWHPLWPDCCLVDLYCHPACWAQAGDLLDRLTLPEAATYLAYADVTCPERMDVLKRAGFRQAGLLEEWVVAEGSSGKRVDVILFAKGRRDEEEGPLR